MSSNGQQDSYEKDEDIKVVTPYHMPKKNDGEDSPTTMLRKRLAKKPTKAFDCWAFNSQPMSPPTPGSDAQSEEVTTTMENTKRKLLFKSPIKLETQTIPAIITCPSPPTLVMLDDLPMLINPPKMSPLFSDDEGELTALKKV